MGRSFIGGSRAIGALGATFYRVFFTEMVVSPSMSYFSLPGVGFHLQDYHVQDCVANTKLFLETVDVEQYYAELAALDLPGRYEGVRLMPI